jgi:hypothetical protein
MSKLDDLLKNTAATNDPSLLDSDLKAASELAKEALATPSKKSGNTVAESMSAGFASHQPSSDLQPDVQISLPNSSADQNSAPRKVRPATAMDMSKITEADVMNLDFIDARSLDVPAMLQVVPKDGNIRFRWVNWKNYEGGNYAMFKAIGFENAVPADIKGDFSDHLKKEDGTIKWFDVILMKVNVLILMGVYKKNIMRALQQVGRWQPQAIAQARRTLENEVGSDVLEQMKKQDLTVEFYAPTHKEMADQDKAFADGK